MHFILMQSMKICAEVQLINLLTYSLSSFHIAKNKLGQKTDVAPKHTFIIRYMQLGSLVNVKHHTIQPKSS